MKGLSGCEVDEGDTAERISFSQSGVESPWKKGVTVEDTSPQPRTRKDVREGPVSSQGRFDPSLGTGWVLRLGLERVAPVVVQGDETGVSFLVSHRGHPFGDGDLGTGVAPPGRKGRHLDRGSGVVRVDEPKVVPPVSTIGTPIPGVTPVTRAG